MYQEYLDLMNALIFTYSSCADPGQEQLYLGTINEKYGSCCAKHAAFLSA